MLSVCPDIVIQVVEIRAKVVDVAYEFFELPASTPSLRIAIEDAKGWLKRAEPSKFDIIFADLYQAQGISEFQLQARFLKACSRVLVDNGCLVANFHDVPPFHSPFFGVLSQMFPTIFLCRVDGGNTILFACKQDLDLDVEKQLPERAEELGGKMGCNLLAMLSRLARVDMG